MIEGPNQKPVAPQGRKNKKKTACAFYVIGIDKCEGSSEAVQTLFRSHLSNVNASFVVVNNFTGHRELRPYMLARYVHLPVSVIQNGTPLEPNRIYVHLTDSPLRLQNGNFTISSPITHIACKLQDSGLGIEQARKVMHTYVHFEAEVVSVIGQWYLMRKQPCVTNGKVIMGYVITFVEVTEMKHVSHQLQDKAAGLQASEEKRHSLLQHATQTIALPHQNNRILSIDQLPQRYRLAGLRPGQLLGLSYVDSLPTAYHYRVKKAIRKIYETGSAQNLQLQMQGPNGVYEVSFVPHLRYQQIIGIIAIVSDITDRLLLERELAQNSDRISKQNRELEEFACFASHNLKASISNLQSLMGMLGKEKLDSRDQLLLQKMEQSLHDLHKTVNSLNEVIALKKTLKLECGSLRFDHVFRQTVRSIEGMVTASGATFQVDSSNHPEVSYPPVHLQRIMQNLITNVTKYQRSGTPPVSELSTGKEQGCVFLRVKDNGLGLNLKRNGKELFGLFRQFQHHVPGDGYSLRIVHAIAETYGGKVEVSQPDAGATFTFLPLQNG